MAMFYFHQELPMRPLNPLSASFLRSALFYGACFLALVAPSIVFAQTQELPLDQGASPTWSRAQSSVLEKTAPEVEDLIRQSQARELSPEETDDIYLVVLARPELALPILERELTEGLRAHELSDRKIAQLRDFIAYAGNEEALQVLARLRSEFEEPRLKGGVTSLLYYAEGRVNPFFLAYSPAAVSNQRSREEVLVWVQMKATHPEGLRDWAEALLSRQEPKSGLAAALDEDPLVSQIHNAGVVQSLREEVARQRRGRPESTRQP
jgi:hypothetical protein